MVVLVTAVILIGDSGCGAEHMTKKAGSDA